MGIPGLLKTLEPVTTDVVLSQLYSQRVAVDGYVWLHRGVYFGGAAIAMGTGKGSYVSYFVNRVKQLLRYARTIHNCSS